MTPLHYACMGGSEPCAKLLLETNSTSGVSVDAKDISGCTPLVYCLNHKSRSMEKVCVCVCVRGTVFLCTHIYWVSWNLPLCTNFSQLIFVHTCLIESCIIYHYDNYWIPCSNKTVNFHAFTFCMVTYYNNQVYTPVPIALHHRWPNHIIQSPNSIILPP